MEDVAIFPNVVFLTDLFSIELCKDGYYRDREWFPFCWLRKLVFFDWNPFIEPVKTISCNFFYLIYIPHKW